jgi:hypothetical protein
LCEDVARTAKVKGVAERCQDGACQGACHGASVILKTCPGARYTHDQ